MSSHSVLSLGVGCYQWGEEEEEEEEEEEGRRERGLVAQVYDVLLLCQEPYTVQPSSLKFLVCHGFDFNKQCSSGLPYTPGLVEVCLCVVWHRQAPVKWEQITKFALHNSIA